MKTYATTEAFYKDQKPQFRQTEKRKLEYQLKHSKMEWMKESWKKDLKVLKQVMTELKEISA